LTLEIVALIVLYGDSILFNDDLVFFLLVSVLNPDKAHGVDLLLNPVLVAGNEQLSELEDIGFIFNEAVLSLFECLHLLLGVFNRMSLEALQVFWQLMVVAVVVQLETIPVFLRLSQL
jgi:hypothetical protein